MAGGDSTKMVRSFIIISRLDGRASMGLGKHHIYSVLGVTGWRRRGCTIRYHHTTYFRIDTTGQRTIRTRTARSMAKKQHENARAKQSLLISLV